jgi:hypothetical protein
MNHKTNNSSQVYIFSIATLIMTCMAFYTDDLKKSENRKIISCSASGFPVAGLDLTIKDETSNEEGNVTKEKLKGPSNCSHRPGLAGMQCAFFGIKRRFLKPHAC